MSKQTVTIAGKEYVLDVEKAMKDGYLSEASPLTTHKFVVGDVFKDPKGTTNSFLLIKTSYYNDEYVILGLGCDINSGRFFYKSHTLNEIKEYLIDEGMVFDRNINREVARLVHN